MCEGAGADTGSEGGCEVMGFPINEFNVSRVFDWKELHKKIGRIVVTQPTDSDIQEGQYLVQLWFVTHEENEGPKMYLLAERP